MKSDANEKVMDDFATLATRMCLAGKGVTGSATAENRIYQNRNIIE